MAPLTSLTHNNTKFILIEDYECAFENVKYVFNTCVSFDLPKLGEPFEFVVDASLIGARVVMLQGARPVAFERRKFSHVARNYTT